MAKRRLGKGIDALLQGRDLEQMEQLSSIVSVPVGKLRPNPNQPRKTYSEEALKELTESVREKGIIQPVLAEEQEDGSYLIIAGERRYRAALHAGLELVPVLPRQLTEEEKIEIALIENLQREDLNPIEEAHALQSLMQTAELTQEELATRLGMNRSTIANMLRLLRLPQEIQDRVAAGGVSSGHARAILSVTDEQNRKRLVERIVEEGISVREAENMAAALNAGVYVEPGSGSHAGASAGTGTAGKGTDERSSDKRDTGTEGKRSQGAGKSVEIKAMEERMLKALGTKVVIKGTDHRGRIEIEYFSMDDLERLYSIIAREEGET